MSSFLSQALQATTSQNTASVISSLNSSSGVSLSDPEMGVVNFPGTFIDGGSYSVVQIAIRSDTTCVVSVIQSFTGVDDAMDGFVTDSYTLSPADALSANPITLYYYISCPHVKVQVVNLQAGNTLFQLAVKLTSASPPVTASATSGDTYTAVDGIPYLNTYIGGQTIIINPTSTVNANIVDQTYTTYQGKSFLNCYIEQENVTISGVNVVSSQLAVVDASGNATLSAINGKITACNTGAAVLAGVNIVSSQLAVKDAAAETSLASIDGKITACNTGAAVLAGVNIVSSQLAVKDAAAETSLASIDGKITACNTGAAVLAGVNIVSSQLAVKDAAAETSLASIDGKITACNTGAAVLAGVGINASRLAIVDVSGNASLSSIDTGINKVSTFIDEGSPGLQAEGSAGGDYDMGVGADRFVNFTVLGSCDTSVYSSPNFIFQYSIDNNTWFSDGVQPSFYYNGTAASFCFQRTAVPSRYVRVLFIQTTVLSSIQVILSK